MPVAPIGAAPLSQDPLPPPHAQDITVQSLGTQTASFQESFVVSSENQYSEE